MPEETKNFILGDKNYIAWVLFIFFIFSVFFCIIIISCDNTIYLTGNGLWKVKQIEGWINNAPDKIIHPAEVFYLPTTGLFARWTPFENNAQNILRKATLINAIFGGLAIGLLFLLIYRLTHSFSASLLGTVFQSGCAFFLFLSITNEDIMPGYAFFVAAVLFAVIFAKRRRYIWLFLFTQMYVMSWLFHWSLIFAGPAFLLAIFMLPGTLRQRCIDSFRFLYLSALMPALIAIIGAVCRNYPPLLILSYTFFPRHGIGTGWGGFSFAKILYAFTGIGQYIFAGVYSSNFKAIFEPLTFITSVTGWVFVLILGYFFISQIRSNWQKPHWRMAGLIFGGTFIMAQALAFYSQPHDPQMQLQPMAWLAVAFAILCRKNHFKKFLFLSLLPLIFNLALFIPAHGSDSRNISQLKKLESATELTNTVFITHGFDQLPSWSFAIWEPKQRHVIPLSDILVRCPQKSPSECSAIAFLQIRRAFQSGCRVVIGPVWDMSEEDFVNNLLAVSGPERIRAIYRVIKERFEAAPLLNTDWGCFYELRLKEPLAAECKI